MIVNNLWQTEEDEFGALSVLNNICRYNTRYRIKDETVAAHSFFVVWFTSVLCSYFDVEDDVKVLAMEAAMLHDVPEIYINDITYDCKSRIPEVVKAIEAHEREVLKGLSDTAQYVLFEPRTPEEKLAGAIVRYADVISVKQYSLAEMNLGNKTFKDIFEGAQQRLDELKTDVNDALDFYERKRAHKRLMRGVQDAEE